MRTLLAEALLLSATAGAQTVAIDELTYEDFGTPFPIGAGGDWDTRPRVYEIEPGRYLVTYVREHTSSSISLVGRFITSP